jgi:outer membrane protein assembly complex protein YaeT
VWLLLAGALAGAQGEPIASLRLEVPAADAARLAPLVELRPGTPLAPDALRHAVELLYATGEFEDVVVHAETTPAGLAIVIRPEPAPLLVDVVREGDRVLDAAALRRLTRLREREALWQPRLERAARDVAVQLTEQGFLEARVTAEARRRAAGADAVFRISAGRLVRVERLALEGVAGSQAVALLALGRPRRGEAYRRRAATDAAERMRKRLVAAGFWRAAVSVREVYDPARARVALAFAVERGAPVSVAFEGDRPGPRLEARVRRLVRDGAARPDALEEASDRVEAALRRRGHRAAVAGYRLEYGTDRAGVVFTTRAGPAAQTASVTVSGAPGLSALPRLRPGEPLEDRRLDEDVRALSRALEEDGHAQAVVEAEAAEGGGQVPVVYRVTAGPRTVVSAFEVVAPGDVPADSSARELRTRPGRPYRARALAQDRADLLAAYRNAGHLDAEVTPELSFSEDRGGVTVRLRVVPGPRTDVDHVVVGGLSRTREQVVRRELSLREREPLGLGRLLESQRRLQGLGLFESVSVSELDPETLGARSVLVAVREGPRTTVSYGLGYAERDLLRGSVEVTRRNLAGLDRSLTGFVRASFLGSRLLASYREPYLLGRKQELFLTAFREEEDREAFDFIRYGGILQTARKLGRDWSLILRGAYQRTSVFAIEVDLEEVDRQFRDTVTAGPSASVVKDTRDDPLDPHRGFFLGGDLQLSSSALGGDSFLKGFLQASSFERLTPRATLALSGRVGLARTFGAGVPGRLPLPDRFFAGGDTSIRGFELDRVGPLEPSESQPMSFVPTGGNALLVANAELRVETARRFSVALFTDAGNVYPQVSELDLGDVRYAAGIGLRYLSALGPLRIDWGFKLNRRASESRSHVHLTIGHAF